jgi:hypothetical protein
MQFLARSCHVKMAPLVRGSILKGNIGDQLLALGGPVSTSFPRMSGEDLASGANLMIPPHAARKASRS